MAALGAARVTCVGLIAAGVLRHPLRAAIAQAAARQCTVPLLCWPETRRSDLASDNVHPNTVRVRRQRKLVRRHENRDRLLNEKVIGRFLARIVAASSSATRRIAPARIPRATLLDIQSLSSTAQLPGPFAHGLPVMPDRGLPRHTCDEHRRAGAAKAMAQVVPVSTSKRSGPKRNPTLGLWLRHSVGLA
jgi:hypothetical protein